MSHRPVYSVVIPTYNRADMLGRALESVLHQEFDDLEVVIVDDHSADHTPDVVESYKDRRIVYHRRERNGGQPHARNDGIDRARGDFVVFLDDDDEFLPSFLKASHDRWAAAGPEVGFSWTGVRWVRPAERGGHTSRDDIWAPSFEDREAAYLSFLRSRRIGTGHGLIIRRACFEHVGGFDPALRVTGDTEFLLRLVRRYSFIVVPGVHVKIHDHSSGYRMRKDARGKAVTYEAILSKHADALAAHPDLASTLHYKTAWLHYHSGSRRFGRRHMRRAIGLAPFGVKAYLAMGLFEVLGPWGPSLHVAFSRLFGASRVLPG